MENEKKAVKTGKPKNNQLVVNFLSSPKYADKLIYIRALDTLFMYRDGKYYRPVELLDLKRDLWTYLANQYPEVGITDGILSDVIKQIYFSIPECYEELDERYIAFEDCLLNIDSLTTESFDRKKISTTYFSFPYASIEDFDTPVFNEFLKRTFVEEDDESIPDESLIPILQEMFGYLLLPKVSAHVSFFLYGNGGNGKSTITNLLSLFFGKEGISAYSIENLTSRPFTVAGLIGKRVNMCNEEESKFIRSDKFKAIISGELVAAERKFGNPFEFCPTTKFVFCTNKMPSFDGVDYGLRRRIKIIPFYRKITDKQRDLFFINKLKAELPGIVRWALEGLKKLRANNYQFSDELSKAAKKIKRDFVNEMSSTLQFFDENYEAYSYTDPDEDRTFIQNEIMYEEYKEWCHINNRKPFSSNKFYQEISRTLDIKSDTKKIGGKPVRGRYVKKLNFDIMDKPPFL